MFLHDYHLACVISTVLKDPLCLLHICIWHIHEFICKKPGADQATRSNLTELQITELTCNRPPYTKRFICDDHELTTIKNHPPSVIMQNYLASCDTPQYFDWLYILQMNNVLRASCKTAHTKRHD